jgi:hypothetical protein
MITEGNFENRLESWVDFRSNLKDIDNSIQKTVEFYQSLSLHTLQVDPWDSDSWPDPWELLERNCYCAFTIVLGIIYTLKLLPFFQNHLFKIHITQNKDGKLEYDFSINDKRYLTKNNQILNSFIVNL